LSTLNGYPEISKLLSETESNFTEASSELMPIDNPWLETAAISTDSHQLSLICDPIHNLALSNPEGFRRLWRDPHCNSQISESLTPAIRAILNNQDLEIAFIFYNKHHETEMTFIEFIDQTDNLGWNCRDWTAALNHTGNPHIAVNQPGKRI
jgi:hypothetical protein